MMTKKFAIGGIAAVVFVFVYEFVLHGLLLKPLYTGTQFLWRAEEDCIFPLMIAGQVIFPIVLGLIFRHGYKGAGLIEGVRFGVLIGLLAMCNHLIMHSVALYPTDLTIAWITGSFLESIAIGVIWAAALKN